MKFHAEVLSPRLTRVLGRVGPTLDQKDFYLGGGTAVALHLGHRRSVDLDWFSPRLDDGLALAQQMRTDGIPFETAQVSRGTLHGRVAGVRVTALEYRYPLLQPPASLPDFHCSLASLEDLARMKLAAVVQRGAKKDFLDVYAILRAIPLATMLALYQRKFSLDDTAHLRYSLVFFDDADRERLPAMLWKVSWRAAKQCLRDLVRSLPD